MNKILFMIVLLLMPSLAAAYPQYIVKGYTNCASCHYSPTGGGLPNSYGYAAQSATFPDAVDSKFLESIRTKLQKNNVTGYQEDGTTPQLQWDIGLDARLLVLGAYTGDDEAEEEGGGGAAKTPMAIPMLFEVGGVLAYGHGSPLEILHRVNRALAVVQILFFHVNIGLEENWEKPRWFEWEEWCSLLEFAHRIIPCTQDVILDLINGVNRMGLSGTIILRSG
jgi:hypothetical protein